MRVKEWMTPDPLTVSPRTSVLNARRLMARYRCRHLPVVVEGERLVGMVHSSDVLLAECQVVGPLSALDWDLLIGRYRAVETVMREPVAVADPEDDVAAATQTMLARRVEALPVVRSGAVVGVLSASDCLRGLVKTVSVEVEGTEAREVEVDPDAYKPVPMEALSEAGV